MTNFSIKPEDILSDDQNTVTLGNVSVRKGSIAAFLKNIDILENPEASDDQKNSALETMKTLAPALVAAGLYKHAAFKNKRVQKLLEEAAI